MTDPAIVAAQRAWDKRRPIDPASSTTFAHEGGIGAFAFVVAAVREALTSIRELHRPFTRDYPGGDGRTVCNHCLGPVNWPCETAYLVYTTEEI